MLPPQESVGHCALEKVWFHSLVFSDSVLRALGSPAEGRALASTENSGTSEEPSLISPTTLTLSWLLKTSEPSLLPRDGSATPASPRALEATPEDGGELDTCSKGLGFRDAGAPCPRALVEANRYPLC